MSKTISRRSFIQMIAGTAALLPLLGVEKLFGANLKSLPAGAKALPESAPLAKVLGYKQDAGTVDVSKFKTFKAGQNCANCAQYVVKNGDWGQCKVLSGGLVTKEGWCRSYVVKRA